MATFKNYYHNETKSPSYTVPTVNITDYYKGGTDRISDIRVSSCEYHFLNGEHFFHTSISISGNCNKYGGLGFKKFNSKEFSTREEANAYAWNKMNRWLKKNEGFEAEVE